VRKSDRGDALLANPRSQNPIPNPQPPRPRTQDRIPNTQTSINKTQVPKPKPKPPNPPGSRYPQPGYQTMVPETLHPTPPSQDPTVGLYLGSFGGPRGRGARLATKQGLLHFFSPTLLPPHHALALLLQGRTRCPRAEHPHGGVQPFQQKLTCLTHSTLGPYVVQIWSRCARNFEPTKPSKSTEWAGPPRRGAEVEGTQLRFRAKGAPHRIVQGLVPECQGQNLALTALCVPYFLK